MHIRAKKSFSYKLPDGRERRVPRGWVGEMPDDIGSAAVADGRAADAGGGSTSPQASAPNTTDENLDGMSHADLVSLAEKRGVQFKKSDSKAEIAAAIKAHGGS